jgi:hypothetical protein
MADRNFEMELERLFAEQPAFPDSDLFALRVDASLDRGWTLRNLLITGLGLAGGLIASMQMMGSGLLPKLKDLATRYAPSVQVQWTDIAVSHMLPGGFEVNGEVLWMSAALAAVAIGLGVTRAIRDI